jgi:hypothetical protein
LVLCFQACLVVSIFRTPLMQNVSEFVFSKENRALARWQVSWVGSCRSEFDPCGSMLVISHRTPAPKGSGVGENPQVKKTKTKYFLKRNCGPIKDGTWNSSVHHSKQLGILQLFAYVCVLLP